MRQIEQNALRAWRKNENFKQGNTEVHFYSSINANTGIKTEFTEFRLFGNLIGRKSNGRESFSNGGWNSLTTLSRLRAFGVNVKKIDGVLYLNGMYWNGSFKHYDEIINS